MCVTSLVRRFLVKNLPPPPTSMSACIISPAFSGTTWRERKRERKRERDQQFCFSFFSYWRCGKVIKAGACTTYIEFFFFYLHFFFLSLCLSFCLSPLPCNGKRCCGLISNLGKESCRRERKKKKKSAVCTAATSISAFMTFFFSSTESMLGRNKKKKRRELLAQAVPNQQRWKLSWKTHTLHERFFFARLAPICMLSWCLLTDFSRKFI